ncbi:unnamed protein product [marine sediment metagenome]|uniref:Uncharacterized protein n=1 Tax=marine sediment metagenome TaxID=412755 RepID=X1GVK0_9ZZZZ
MKEQGERRIAEEGRPVFHNERRKSLSDLGISEAKSHRWQLIARLPKKEREKYYKKEKKKAVNIRPFRLKGLRKNLRNL